MTKRMYAMLSISALVVALAVPLMAQSIRLTANIPFEFTVGTKTLPAGEYEVQNAASPFVLFIQGQNRGAAAYTPTNRHELRVTGDPAAQIKLVFHRYGNSYFLSEVREGYAAMGFEVPMSHTERELTKTASAQHYEVLATMARR
jgi:hypothetical protein